MAHQIEVIEKEIGNALEIYEEIKMMEMPKVMGADYKKILEHLKNNNSEMLGAPYARYIGVDWEVETNKGFFGILKDVFTKKWKIQIGMVSSKKLTENGNIKPIVHENKKYVKTIHKGPYQKVGATYKALFNYIKENNLDPENESFEFYLNDPGKVSKEELETEVLIPVK